jgi:hypothetical protein
MHHALHVLYNFAIHTTNLCANDMVANNSNSTTKRVYCIPMGPNRTNTYATTTSDQVTDHVHVSKPIVGPILLLGQIFEEHFVVKIFSRFFFVD